MTHALSVIAVGDMELPRRHYRQQTGSAARPARNGDAVNNAICRGRMIAPDLVEIGPAGARIVAWRRKTDGKVVFPSPPPGVDQSEYEGILLHPSGSLWSWTVQRFRPKSPPYLGPEADEFRPYIVGYVEFPEGIIVEGRIDAAVDSYELRIGMPMDTTVIPLFTDADGELLHIYAFRPANSSSNSKLG